MTSVGCPAPSRAPNGVYLPAADQTQPRTSCTNMENAELYIVFPWNIVNLDSPEADRRRLENTWNHRTWRLQNNGWAQDCVQIARMGWREALRQALREHTSYNQRFPNGLFISPAPPKFHGLLTDTPYFDNRRGASAGFGGDVPAMPRRGAQAVPGLA